MSREFSAKDAGEMTPEEIQELIDQGIISIQVNGAKDKLKLFSRWKFGDKNYWIIKIKENDFSLFDGMGVLDVSWTSHNIAIESMRESGATRIFKV